MTKVEVMKRLDNLGYRDMYTLVGGNECVQKAIITFSIRWTFGDIEKVSRALETVTLSVQIHGGDYIGTFYRPGTYRME